MCKWNNICPAGDGQCNCGLLFQINKLKNYSSENAFASPDLSLLAQAMCQQAEIITLLLKQTQMANEKINEVSEEIRNLKGSNSSSAVIIPSNEATTSWELLSMICGDHMDFQYKIELLSTIPYPVYKERAFCLVSKLVDLEGNEISLPKPVRFKIMLFTTERPAKLLINNTSGDKVMRGTIETESDSLITFNNIVVKEVTSHFRNGCFFLVVAPFDANYIEPLIIENVVVKARKVMSEDHPRKKQKLEEINLKNETKL
ncbi:unnamed protein product [Blepharisma stoltei]|uniref:Uncharacterized protein n=1 Tax=Blepharisma stoltei TaxID=1481888 RepID=A0AAU9JVQ6_9CILI|nr:unnamed protein product [Blepharisma stoltei]